VFINSSDYNTNEKLVKVMPRQIIFRRKLIENRGSLLVNIPAELVEAFNLTKGDEMEITMDGELIQLKPTKEK